MTLGEERDEHKDVRCNDSLLQRLCWAFALFYIVEGRANDKEEVDG